MKGSVIPLPPLPLACVRVTQMAHLLVGGAFFGFLLLSFVHLNLLLFELLDGFLSGGIGSGGLLFDLFHDVVASRVVLVA